MPLIQIEGSQSDIRIQSNRFTVDTGDSMVYINTDIEDLQLLNNELDAGGLVVIEDGVVAGSISGNRSSNAQPATGVAVIDVATDMDGDDGVLTVEDNHILFPAYAGIRFADGTGGTGILNCEIKGNKVIKPGGAADDTYDGILLEGHCSDNRVEGNKVVPRDLGSQTRSGIRIDNSNCVDNIVTHNILKPVAGYGTDALDDNGTGTILEWPADATYGDNVT